jgi:anti-sigma factor RsiW
MHTEWTDRFSAYLDGELDDAARRRVDAHLASCAECARVLDELRRVTAWAREYPGRAPERDAWPAIRAAIDARKVVSLPARRPAPRLAVPSLIAAALVLAAVGGGAVWLAVGPGARPAVDSRERPAPAAISTSAADYDLAVRDLEQVLEAGRARLDTATVRVLEESLRTIDRAIDEARAAIQRDSSQAYLSGRIAAHLRQKLTILRLAARAIDAET